MQHARHRSAAPTANDTDLSQYLRHGPPGTEHLRQASLHRTGRSAGHMNTAGSTLIVGKTRPPAGAGTSAAARVFSEPLAHLPTPGLSHSRSVGDTSARASQRGPPVATPAAGRAHDEPAHLPESAPLTEPAQLTVWFHEPASYAQDVMVDPAAFPGVVVGGLYELQPVRRDGGSGQKLVFVVRPDSVVTRPPGGALGASKAKPGFQISLAAGLQKLLDVPPRAAVQVRAVAAAGAVQLDSVEIHIRDVNLSRDSQWSLLSEMVGTCCHVDQRVSFMGSRIGAVRGVFKDGRKRFSGYVGSDTSIVFRSESAKLVFLVQLSREMWHFEENGEIMFHKLVNTLFPMIFHKWRATNAHHAITIVLFTTVDSTRAPWTSLGAGERPARCQDYYRVVVDQVSVFMWDKIMANLRLEFANFKRDILLRLDAAEYKIRGEPCPAVKGNLLEAINLSLALVSDRYRNTDLRHTINHLVMVTPGTGLFDVDHELMLDTSKKMFSLDCALDIVCLSQPPLHTVPLFRYRSDRGDVCHCVPKWCDMSFYGAAAQTSSQWIPRCKIYELQMMGLMENEVKDVLLDRIHFSDNVPVVESMNDYDDTVFSPVNKKPLIVKHRFLKRKDRGLPLQKISATLSLMRKADDSMASAQRAATNVSTTNSSVNGLVTHISMANSALSTLYTLNKTGEDVGSKSRRAASPATTTSAVKTARSLSSLSETSNQGAKVLRVTADANLRNEISKSSRANQQTRKRELNKSLSSTEKRKSAFDIEVSEREENNPYWMSVDNPSEPQPEVAAQCSRWADVFPPKIKRRMFKWRSFKAPAALPIGTTLFPTSSQMETEYTFQIYVVTLNWENRLELKTMKDLMREMIRLRLALGFQICYGDKVKRFEAERKSGGYPEGIIKYFPSGDCAGARIYLSLNEEIHRIFLDYNGSLNVQLYKRVKSEEKMRILLGSHLSKSKHKPLIRTRYADEYTPSKVTERDSIFQYFNWNQMDQLIAGYEDAVPETNRHFRQMKFVVIPGPISANAYQITNEKLSEEEIRLEGLRKLIALIERGRYRKNEDTTKSKEEFFPEIHFYTGNLHDFLNEQAEYYNLSGTKPSNSLMITDGLRFNTNIKLSQLAQELQTEGGLKLVDRTWHFKLHPHCFLGCDLVTWIINLFDNIDSREAATDYGQSLMDKNLFCHVENRHGFLDGHYFYEFHDEFVDQTYKARAAKKSWFLKKQPHATEEAKELKESPISTAPQTPLSMAPNTPSLTRANSVTSTGDSQAELKKTVSHYHLPESEASSLTESQTVRRRKKFMISKHVKYNCDPSGKSFRPELLDVHYDSVHNPEHCYHIRLQWLSTTTKFIDETVINWSRFCERYGLKLVETPWREVCTIPEINPFHSFVDLKLAVNPLQDTEFKDLEILKTNRFYFHLHFLKVADFLLDNRGTSFFLKDPIEISYSWGKPTFKYAQFIHKSGAYIVELRDNGEFSMAPNNVHILRMNTFVNPGTEQSGKNSILDSQRVLLKFRECCRDESFLRQVFRDASKFLQEDYDAAYVVGM
ncbi:hypothetical protein METBIDRAFT_35051 [Metschnikowia bicuspidata var. bicuspidata NRRL YB-4993]|uniref:Vacuolar membrane-associated protein IML1 n=1 Tax=Metschnikowia bicuspidata var. bicuspidata NRRL YB-4993 TaxID=869754 RepID=A0A1A0HIW0_9ASCO|nr:hypothetical protein METBIDRAFT_35051 [Metschnikowia bicuspidata var. bicuspidata NRRL YB-4993]OBA23822.1 hypothetical protein METBIDRAFT_35051 [Metschnikowia bicuspidata var. bicuspidata NRRL YB-4993]